MNKPTPTDYLHLHFIVFLWGFTAILGQLIPLPSVELVLYRTLLAALALAILIKLRNGNFKLELAELAKIVFVGGIISAHWILFFASASVSSISICLAGMATGTLWTALLEPLIRKRAFKAHELLLGLLIIAGLYVIFRFEFDHALGLTMAIGSAICGSVFTIFNSGFTKRHSPVTITFYEMLGAFFTTLLFLPVYAFVFKSEEGLQLIPAPVTHFLGNPVTEGVGLMWTLALMAILVGICTVYAFSASVNLMRRVSAFTMNLTVNLEPVYGIILAVIIFGEKEKMSTGFYLGTLIILFAVLIYPVLDRFVEQRKARLMQKALPN